MMKRIFLCLFILILIASVQAIAISNSAIPTGDYSIISKTGNESVYQVKMDKIMMQYNEKEKLWETILIWLGIIDPKVFYRQDTNICIQSNVASVRDYSIPATLSLSSKDKIETLTSAILNRELIKARGNIRPVFENGDIFQFCYQANPEKDFYLKFGEESIIIVGDATYNATTTNSTLETGFAHLVKSNEFLNLVAYYSFDEVANIYTTTFYDYVGSADITAVLGAFAGSNCSSVTYNEDPCYEWGPSGYCLYNDCLFFPQSVSEGDSATTNINFGTTNNVTLCFWEYHDASSGLSTHAIFCGTGFCSEGASMAFKTAPTAFLNFGITLPTNKWQHICYDVSKGENKANLYFNGAYNSSVSCDTLNTDQATCEAPGCTWTSYSCSNTYSCGSLGQIACGSHNPECTWGFDTCGGNYDCAVWNNDATSCNSATPMCTWDPGATNCHDYDSTDQSTCEANSGCHWNSGDNTCYGSCSGTGSCNFGNPECTIMTPAGCLPSYLCSQVSNSCGGFDSSTCTTFTDIGCVNTPQNCTIPTLSNIQNIGADGLGNFFGGALDEIMVFNISLNSSQISDIYNNVSNRFENTGEFSFQNINFTSNTLSNITLNNYSTFFDGNISGTIGNGSEVNFTGYSITNYDLPDADNNQWENLTIRLYSGNSSNFFYTPIVIGNITLDDWTSKDNPPYWITIPSPAIISYDTSLSVDFIAGDDTGIDTYIVNSTQFSFNTSGTLTNVSTLELGIYYLNVSINDTIGQANDTEFNVTINQAVPSLVLTADPSWSISGGTQSTIIGNNCPAQLTCSLFRSDLSVSNPDTQTLGTGSYPYVYNCTENANYTAGSATNTLSVGIPAGLGGAIECPEDHFGYYNPNLPRIKRGDCNG